MPAKHHFFPRNKPKSWVVFIVCILSGVTISAPLVALGYYFDIKLIEVAGRCIFVVSWVIGFLAWGIYIYRLVSGRYKHIEEKGWKDQLW